MADFYQIDESEPDDKPIAYVLVGLPGSGKSSWAREHPQKLPIAASDSYIEDYATQHKITYAKAFEKCYPAACKALRANVDRFVAEKTPFIWDQVNLNPEERLIIHNILTPTHHVIYVCFRVPLEECIRRHKARKRDAGHIVDEDRIRMLAKMTKFPKPGEEPFHKVINVTHPGWVRKD